MEVKTNAKALYTYDWRIVILAKREINASDRDFLLELAFSTKSKIFDTVDSPNSFVVLIFNKPVILMQPLITLSFIDCTSLGKLSPVKATCI